jgi:hypothetical protein
MPVTSRPQLVPRRGRPRKFVEASRAVTLTLPESVLAALSAIDHDLSRAVVRVTQPEVAKRPHPPAEVTMFGRRGVIVIHPSRTLEEQTGIMLVPLSDGRALISFDDSMTAAGLELLIQDALEARKLPETDARIFEHIREILKAARHSKTITLQKRNIIVIESYRPRKTKGRSAAPIRRA